MDFFAIQASKQKFGQNAGRDSASSGPLPDHPFQKNRYNLHVSGKSLSTPLIRQGRASRVPLTEIRISLWSLVTIRLHRTRLLKKKDRMSSKCHEATDRSFISVEFKMTGQSYPTTSEERGSFLTETRNRKMTRSSHAYVRGNTSKFYDWLGQVKSGALPEGPPVWICGDCHVGNLGPLANLKEKVSFQIRDLDQTVIGNPAHDLIRLGLSLASAARGSDLPGVTTALMIERMTETYRAAFASHGKMSSDAEMPEAVSAALILSKKRTWRDLARERIKDEEPLIPLGKRFWPLEQLERTAIEALFKDSEAHTLVTQLRGRVDDAEIKVVDAAYWMKGCSSLGLLRYAVLIGIGLGRKRSHCLIDIKEGVAAKAPSYPDCKMPKANAERIVAGARLISPVLGERMRAVRLLNKSVFLRELLPQDLQIEIETLETDSAVATAGYFASVVGQAHSRQMDATTRKRWRAELGKNRSSSLDAPSWLWRSVIDLLAHHERGYLDHCRRFAR